MTDSKTAVYGRRSLHFGISMWVLVAIMVMIFLRTADIEEPSFADFAPAAFLGFGVAACFFGAVAFGVSSLYHQGRNTSAILGLVLAAPMVLSLLGGVVAP